ncbi:hypothetical protein [uncultured Maricaulis sp.]|uniref:hypothetical protein n=1 Tax=uncultured Maricaulis sp. TaxID=174710 RepID=UPI0030D7EEE1|tara:strand:- start:234278 stop:235084 length:807 start_codon:yes stop_codon:yes gene_type:complete
MKTAMIAMLPALLLCSAAQAQLGGVTGTAGSAVEQARDPALAEQIGQTGTDLNTSRFGGPRSRIETLRARQAERAARRASEAAAVEAESQARIQSQSATEAGIVRAESVAGARSETAQTARTAETVNAEASGETSLEAAVRQQLAEIQARSTPTPQLALAPSARLTTTAPAPARVTYVNRSGPPASGYRTTHRETVIVHDPQTTARTQPNQAAAAEIRFEPQTPPAAASSRSTSGQDSTSVWPVIIAGLLIALLLGLTHRFGQGRRTA